VPTILVGKPVAVHRVDHLAEVDEVDHHPLADLRLHDLGRRERLAVDDEEPAQLADHLEVLAVVLLRGVLRVDLHDPVQALRLLGQRVVVRVVEERAGRLGLELVGERLARVDDRLGHVRHAVLAVREHRAVDVDDRRLGQLVLEHDLQVVALGHAEQRAGDHAVVRPGVDELARGDFPLDDLRRQLEHLDAVDELRLETWLPLVSLGTVAACDGRRRARRGPR
jgi:hypothetical protein